MRYLQPSADVAGPHAHLGHVDYAQAGCVWQRAPVDKVAPELVDFAVELLAGGCCSGSRSGRCHSLLVLLSCMLVLVLALLVLLLLLLLLEVMVVLKHCVLLALMTGGFHLLLATSTGWLALARGGQLSRSWRELKNVLL